MARIKTNPDDMVFVVGTTTGLTKREYLTVRLLEGLCSNSKYSTNDRDWYVNEAIALTDKLVEGLNK